MEVKLQQYEKHAKPTEITEKGISIDVKPPQLEYLLSVDYQYYTL